MSRGTGVSEQWLGLAFAPGYEMSSLGRMRSYWRPGSARNFSVTPHVIKPRVGPNGYQYVNIRVGGKARVLTVHSLVATAFHGFCPKGLECRHLDGDQANNRAENLAWGTRAQNAADRIRHGTMPRGEDQAMAKLTTAAVLEIRRLRAAGAKQKTLAHQFNVSRSLIGLVATRKIWAHV